MKVQKIKTTGLQKIGRIILWLLVAFLLLQGIVSILSSGEKKQVHDLITSNKEQMEMQYQRQIGASAFAEGFIREFYTFGGTSDDDYDKRIKTYLNSQAEIKPLRSSKSSSELVAAETVQVRFVNQNEVDVDVVAKVRYRPATTESGIEKTEDICLRVPVICEEDRFAVRDLPIMIPMPEKAKVIKESPIGGEVSSGDKKEIRSVLESFLKTYYEGTAKELSYYTTSDSKITKGMEGRVLFDKLEFLSIYSTPDTDKFVAQASILVNDNGQSIQQRYFIILVKDDRFYIQNIQTQMEE